MESRECLYSFSRFGSCRSTLFRILRKFAWPVPMSNLGSHFPVLMGIDRTGIPNSTQNHRYLTNPLTNDDGCGIPVLISAKPTVTEDCNGSQPGIQECDTK